MADPTEVADGKGENTTQENWEWEVFPFEL